MSQLSLTQEEQGKYDSALENLKRWRKIKGESSEYLFNNRLGNLEYRRGEYAAAAEFYRLALEAAPDDDVIHSNLALALENLRQPENRTEELEEAVKALRRALELQSGNAEYKNRLHNLEAERRFVKVYGEEALKFEATFNAIRVEIQESLYPDLLNATFDALSEETLAKAEAMRARIVKQYGLTIPGVNFGVMTYYYGSPEYIIRIMERDEYQGFPKPGARFAPFEDVLLDQPIAPTGTWLDDGETPPDSKEVWPVNEYILHHVQNIAEHHLAEFVGHQEAFNYLQASELDEAKAILEKPEELTLFVQVLRGLLRMKISIDAVEPIVKEFTRMREAGSDVNAIIDGLSVSLNESAATGEAQA